MNPRDGKPRAYIAHCRATGLVKIGVSRNHRKRIRHLTIESGYPAELVAILRGGAWRERALHRRFADYAVGYEWFRPEGNLAEWLIEQGHGRILEWPVSNRLVGSMKRRYARRARLAKVAASTLRRRYQDK